MLSFMTPERVVFLLCVGSAVLGYYLRRYHHHCPEPPEHEPDGRPCAGRPPQDDYGVHYVHVRGKEQIIFVLASEDGDVRTYAAPRTGNNAFELMSAQRSGHAVLVQHTSNGGYTITKSHKLE